MGIPLPLSQFQPYYIAACWATTVFFICYYLDYFLTSINYFCWIMLVCIYRYAFRHILVFFTLLVCT